MLKKTQLFKYARKIHKWAGLILGFQLLAWVAGGVVMSVIPMDLVHGDHLVKRQSPSPLPLSEYHYSLDRLVANVADHIHSIDLTSILGQAVYKVKTDQQTLWLDGRNGQPLSRLSAEQITQLARQYYVGHGELLGWHFLARSPQEMRQRKNVWQVTFDDAVNTTLYLTPDDGRLVGVRSDIWRFYDFFWMLHIMDYTERSDSNNWLLIISSICGLLFSISGMVLLLQVIKFKHFRHQKRMPSRS